MREPTVGAGVKAWPAAAERCRRLHASADAITAAAEERACVAGRGRPEPSRRQVVTPSGCASGRPTASTGGTGPRRAREALAATLRPTAPGRGGRAGAGGAR